MDRVKQRIISSVFEKRSPSGGFQESYVSHVKIWEDTEEGGRKPRYILLSQAGSGQGFIHKSKMNTNSSFSVGKTWKLSELRGLEVINPGAFNITLARTYRWQTEDPREQAEFIAATVRTFSQLYGGAQSSLTLINVPEPDANGTNSLPNGSSRTPTPSRNPIISHSSPTAGRDSPGPIVNSRAASQIEGSQLASPLSSRSAFSSSMRPDSMASLRSSASLPSVNVPRTAAPGGEMPPPIARPTPEQNSRQSLETIRTSSASDRPAGAATSRVLRPHSPASSSVPAPRSRNTPSPIPPPSQSRDTPSPIPPPAPPVRAPTPQSRRSRRRDSDDSERTQPRRETSNSQIAPGRKDPNARISFFDPSNQSSIDRLLTTTNSGRVSSAGFEEEGAEATMANVEEMLEGYEWAGENTFRTGSKGKRRAADQIEARLQDELMALEKANIYAFLEDDDRVSLVLKFIDDAVRELDNMDTSVSSYKIHLNAVSDDISYIQSQNRGLQVQTQNQKALLVELDKLLQTVHVDREALITLTQESLEKSSGIQHLEEAASELYKALLAGRDTEMAASMERLEEYRTHNNQFCKRLHDFLQIMFSVQSDRTLTDKARVSGEVRRHEELELYLGRYSGLMLYLKEMGEDWYSKVCAAYFSSASALHSQEMKGVFSSYTIRIRKATEEETEMGFSLPQASTIRVEPLRRAKSMVRSPLDGRKDKEKRPDGELRGSEALDIVLRQIGPQIYHEEQFIADFLQINDASLTYADYLNLENYFRRQASRSTGLGPNTMKLVRGAMDLIFGFLAGEIKTWIDANLAKDNMQLVGSLVALEAAMTEGEEKGNMFWTKVLQKQHQRVKGLFDRHVDEQIRAIEQTKLTTKKRKGVAHFIKYFPVYVGRIESQLVGADVLDIRAMVDMAYERIVQTMFDSLKQMAKMQGESEDKGQLNYHVELAENMQYFISEISQQEVGTVKMFLQRAQALYDENLNAYVRLVLRRPLARILDYFDGVDHLLQTTAASEIQNNSNYNKSSLKRVIKEYTIKDIRRHVDSLYKRVEKHFTDPGEEHSGSSSNVVKAVWTACEQELVKSTERFARLLAQCYKDTGVSLEYNVQDVEAAFRKHRIGGQS